MVSLYITDSYKTILLLLNFHRALVIRYISRQFGFKRGVVVLSMPCSCFHRPEGDWSYQEKRGIFRYESRTERTPLSSVDPKQNFHKTYRYHSFNLTFEIHYELLKCRG